MGIPLYSKDDKGNSNSSRYLNRRNGLENSSSSVRHRPAAGSPFTGFEMSTDEQTRQMLTEPGRGLGNFQGWSVWRRNTRQRGEFASTSALGETQDAGNLWRRRREDNSLEASQAVEHTTGQVTRHSFKLRLGYDPRIFLKDPTLRGQQLTAAAEAWAASYREHIPMATDLQVARRNDPTPHEAAHLIFPTTSEDEEEPVADQTLAENLAQNAHAERASEARAPYPRSTFDTVTARHTPFRTASSRQRLSMLRQEIATASENAEETPFSRSQEHADLSPFWDDEGSQPFIPDTTSLTAFGIGEQLRTLLTSDEAPSSYTRRLTDYLHRQQHMGSLAQQQVPTKSQGNDMFEVVNLDEGAYNDTEVLVPGRATAFNLNNFKTVLVRAWQKGEAIFSLPCYPY